MPLRRTVTLANLNDYSDENQYQSQKTNPQSSLSLPRQSSPLSPCQNSLPGRPLFPPSGQKPDLYREALKRSARQAARQARQARRYIRNKEKKELERLQRSKKLV
jgi:hypothetical protein